VGDLFPHGLNTLNLITNSPYTTAVSQVRAIHVYDFDNTCESSRSQLPLYFEAHIVQYS
jgi:hypothetical protein